MPPAEDLFFKQTSDTQGTAHLPLAARMRPRTLGEFVGQEHILGQGKLLRRAIDSDRLSSLILYGPPGVGKTALAFVISGITASHYERINAVSSNVQELRHIIKAARDRQRFSNKKTILFIDEIHRFNKAQQDVLMPDLEERAITLIGATTHNPFFSLLSPLLSRSLIFELKRLTVDEITTILSRSLNDRQRGLGTVPVTVDADALRHIAALCDGDARRALNALEVGILTTPPGKDGTIHFTLAVAEESIQKKAVVYDRDEDAHYDVASAFIKSMRGSDPDAALYWLAKMLYAGEDPRFIARRIVICAAEDVGNADPMALVVATAALQASEFVGLPECKIPLAQAVTYIATCPKSNAAYMGIEKAERDVAEGRTLDVPVHLQDAHYPGAERLGHGKGYKYSHSHDGHYVEQEYIPEARHYYCPSDQGHEETIRKRLGQWKSSPGQRGEKQ
ncbi:MAG: replication-associated recombination protein A [Candidatus Omnitrophica bacterium]|nr:replication-associated recombination protein A [Candidatus Omnitrophota bacterium]